MASTSASRAETKQILAEVKGRLQIAKQRNLEIQENLLRIGRALEAFRVLFEWQWQPEQLAGEWKYEHCCDLDHVSLRELELILQPWE